MKHAEGFTLIEVLVVITIIATLAGLVTVLVPYAIFQSNKTSCIHNVGQLTGALETLDTGRYPKQSGVNMLLYLVQKQLVGGKDGLKVLFCPGDANEGLEEAGGVAAYENLDLDKLGEHGHLSSYAARDQRTPETRARRGAVPAQVLVADDSDDHHDSKGIVIGLTGGTAKWRDKVDDYERSVKDALVVGKDSDIPELVCLMRD